MFGKTGKQFNKGRTIAEVYPKRNKPLNFSIKKEAGENFKRVMGELKQSSR